MCLKSIHFSSCVSCNECLEIKPTLTKNISEDDLSDSNEIQDDSGDETDVESAGEEVQANFESRAAA